MKNIFCPFLFVFLFSGISSFAHEEKLDKYPEPFGGIEAIIANLIYSQSAKEAGIEGKVFVKAMIDEKGNVAETEVIKSVNEDCDKAAVDANKTVIDTVETWRDYFLSEVKKVIYIPFEKQKPEKIIRNGKPWTSDGSLLYDEGMRNTFESGYRISNHINKIPPNLKDTISFPFVISDAPDNSIIVFAGKRNTSNKWAIFVDQNNDNEIENSEFVFEALEITDTTKHKQDTINVTYDNLVNGYIKKDTIVFIISSYNKPILDNYKSCLREDAPILGYSLFSDLREGILQYNNNNIRLGALLFYTGHNYGFKYWFNLLIDFNDDNIFDMSNGSSENIEIYNESIDKSVNLGAFALNIIDI